jgi:predicted DNA-binding protein YlxM (UPF0122 family)
MAIDGLTFSAILAVSAAFLVLLVARRRPVIDPGWWCLGLAAGAMAAGVAYGLLFKPGWRRVAVAVDRAGLSERVVTAAYYSGVTRQGDGDPTDLAAAFARAQRRDTLERLKSFRPEQALPVKWPARAWRGLTVGLVAVVALAVWPNPMAAVAERDKAVRKAVTDQVKAVEKVSRDLDKKLAAVDPKTAAEVQKALTELAKELKRARSAEEALKALAKAQDKLAQRAGLQAAGSQAGGAGQGLSELASGLKATKAGQAAGEKIASGEAQGAKQELDKLAGAAPNLSSGDREEISRVLGRAAGSTSGGALARAAAAASQALAGSDESAGTQAMQALSSAVQAAMEAATGSQSLANAQSTLQAAQSAVAQAGRLSQAAQSGQGQRGQSGSGSQGGQGNQAGPGSGSTGSGQGSTGSSGSGSSGSSGSGQGQSGGGQGSGSGQGTSGQGQSGSGGGSSGAGSGSTNTDAGSGGNAPNTPGQTNPQNPSGDKVGQYERLYDPTRLGGDGQTSAIGGKLGQGDSEFTDTSQASLGSSGLVPYSEVFGSYSREAMTAVDNGYLPASLKDLIRQYFGSLDPGAGN